MAKHKTATRKRDDAAWVEKVVTKLIKDAGITSRSELEGNPELDECFLPAMDMTFAGFDGDLHDLMTRRSASAVAVAGTSPPHSPACGTRRTCIRIHERVLLAFKAEAAKTGTPYQTLMKRVLNEAAETLV